MHNELTLEDWHIRYTQQARWTRSLRQYIYQRVNIHAADSILDAGCGTGALEQELIEQGITQVTGLDRDSDALCLAMRSGRANRYVHGDARTLPFPDQTFQITLCHFLLLWTPEPVEILQEMKRVTCNGGAVLALAEPDYGGRIDYPHELGKLGEIQMQSLRRQGADPLVGRKLSALFYAAGLGQIECGVMGGQWSAPPTANDWETEWQMLDHDLGGLNPETEQLKKIDWLAWQNRERILFVPTFYAFGRNYSGGSPI